WSGISSRTRCSTAKSFAWTARCGWRPSSNSKQEDSAHPATRGSRRDIAMTVQVLANDPYDQQLVANVHPPDWFNPQPAPRYHLMVIGGGTAGLVTAAGAAGLGAKVALVEREL